MPEAQFYQDGCALDFTPVAAAVGGEVVQLRDGRAGVLKADLAAGELGAASVEGIYTVDKTGSLVIVDGQRVYWDHSANSAHIKTVNDRDFYLGTAYGDAASAATTMKVELNVTPSFLIDSARDAFVTAVVGAEAATGAPSIAPAGSATALRFVASTEAEKLDLLSARGFAVGAKAIAEFGFMIVDDGDDAALDFNIGVANATHASDADSITESCFIHMDGNVLNILAESDDGTTEVAATDTLINLVLGTPVLVVMDFRNLADIQIYVDGVAALAASTFKLDAATGPLKLLAHLEKSSNDTTAEYYINHMVAWIAEQ